MKPQQSAGLRLFRSDHQFQMISPHLEHLELNVFPSGAARAGSGQFLHLSHLVETSPGDICSRYPPRLRDCSSSGSAVAEPVAILLILTPRGQAAQLLC